MLNASSRSTAWVPAPQHGPVLNTLEGSRLASFSRSSSAGRVGGGSRTKSPSRMSSPPWQTAAVAWLRVEATPPCVPSNENAVSYSSQKYSQVNERKQSAQKSRGDEPALYILYTLSKHIRASLDFKLKMGGKMQTQAKRGGAYAQGDTENPGPGGRGP